MTTDNIVQFPSAARVSNAGRRLIPSKLTGARVLMRLNQSELAREVGITRQAISAFERGEKAPDPTTMDRISEALKQPISFFISESLPVFGNESPRFFRAFGPKTKKRNLMCDELGKTLVQTAKFFDEFINYPSIDVPAYSAQDESGRYSGEEIECAAEECRKAWGLGVGPISNVISLLESKGIIISRYEVDNENIEAFSFWNGERPFIFMASNKDSAVRARFDLAHELGHLVLHRWVGVDEIEDPKTLKLIEAEANRFAGAFLLPRKSFPNEVFSPRLDGFISLKERWKVAIQAMVYRCKNLGVFDEDQVTNLYKQISYRKMRKREPLDDVIPFEKPKLLQRAVDLLLDANRFSADEIVTDLQFNREMIERLCGLQENALKTSSNIDPKPTLK
ncbi:helix-turn-helix domain-containing protein [Terasakiella sp.]|uniref:helix-turn-helix domain-containing protein n=1 Tax=Terasakiella sp. TaxID=2034861 RepID=UPI003AA7C45A